MISLNIEGVGTFEVPAGQRLVQAIEDSGVDIGHRCGGQARCTTCQVAFLAGEPTTMTQAEYDKLVDRNLLGKTRLACQIIVEDPMHVAVIMRQQDMGWADPGPAVAEMVTPEAEWLPLAMLQAKETG